jgi:hypothetical protein
LRFDKLETLVVEFGSVNKVIKVRKLHDHMQRASNSILSWKPWGLEATNGV